MPLADIVVFDCREGDATREVAGLPLVARHARAAARAGKEGVVFLTRDEARVRAALRRRPPPPTLRVSIEARDPAPGEVTLAGLAVYDGKLEVVAESVATDAEAAEAERRLYATIRKSIQRDGIIAYYFQRPPARLITGALLATAVTPNQVTVAAMVVGISGGLLAAGGGWLRSVLACCIVWFGAVIDCVDGEMARLRLEGSKLGEWLDTLADDLSNMALLFGLGYGLFAEGRGDLWRTLALVGVAVGVATSLKVYADLHRLRLPIDTAQYPWFFGKPSEAPPRGAAMLTYLFRRDAFITILGVFCLVGLRREAFLSLMAGTCVMGALLCVHLLIRRRRPG